ncbi:MAG: hypothetical protein GX862_09495 [Leucobacter sp.]|nr:hypothetical protein [Leucobacter sp.]
MTGNETQYSNDELISQRVNHLLFINRLTRRGAADQLGISHSAFNTKINGGSSWKADELVALTDKFDVSFDFLIGRQPIEFARPLDSAASGGDGSVTDGDTHSTDDHHTTGEIGATTDGKLRR